MAEKADIQKLSDEERKRLAKTAKQTLPQRVGYFASLMNVAYGRVSIRAQHTRWGSCSAKKNLNFNCLLCLCPQEVADYVIIHELCHLKELNHSPAFWALVSKYCPDYKAHKKWLKEEGSKLIQRLP